MRRFAILALPWLSALVSQLSAQTQPDLSAIRVKAPTITWTYDSRQRDRDRRFSPNPRFTQIPITIEHDHFDTVDPDPVLLREMELTVSVFPILTKGGHWACQHMSSGTGFWDRKHGATLWCRGETPNEDDEMATGGGYMGRLRVAWSVEEPAGMVPTPPLMGPDDQLNTITGMNGWDWIRLTATLFPKSNNWGNEAAWGVEIPQEPALLAIVNVNTGYLPPGVYGISTTKLTSDGTKRGTHLYGVGWPRPEIKAIHHLGYIVIHPDEPVKRSGFVLDDGSLGVVRSIIDDDEWEFPIPIPE